MALDPDFLKLLVAPGTQKRLVELPPSDLSALNERIQKGGVRNQGGATVARPLGAALQPEGVRIAFPVEEGIPILLTSEAIPLDAGPGEGPGASTAR